MKYIKEKKLSDLREISIEGCEELGRGAHGAVYKIDQDMLVKVYYSGVSMDDIRKEQALARWAFVKGVPTAIPFDIVRVGEHFGTVFELLNALPASVFIRDSQKNLEYLIDRSVELMKLVHSIKADQDELPDMKQQTLEWAENIKDRFTSAQNETMLQLINRIPDRKTLLHADYHLKNIMICNNELMLIDMDTLCTGDPIFELSTVYVSYRQFPSIDPMAAAMLGIDVKTANHICDRTMELYLGESGTQRMEETIKKARILGCVRIIDFMDRHRDHPATEMCINRCLHDLIDDI